MDNISASEHLIGHTITNQFGDRYFSSLNPTAFAQFNATEVFNAEFAHSLFTAHQLHIIVGTDSGLLPQYIIAHGLPEGTRYLFIEPESIAQELQQAAVLAAHPHIAYANEHTWLHLAQDFKLEDYFFIQGAYSHRAFCVKDSMISAYAELSWFIDEKLQQLYYETTVSTGTEPFLTQQILNIPCNQHPLRLLKDAFKGKTAFVLGGGPSLDTALPWLIQHRQSLALFAVSRITKRLLDVGLEPDFVFSVDPFPTNFDVSKDIFSLSTRPVLVCNNHVYTQLINQWPGRSFYFGECVPWDSPLNVENFGSWGPTVTNAAINAAYQLGFARIFLAGVDFCYTLDGFTHAQGSMEHAMGARFKLTSAEVETYSGAMAPTGLDYAYARDMLEAQVQEVTQASQCQLANTALMAAKVKGIDYQPLAAINFAQEPVLIQPIIDACLFAHQQQSFFERAADEVRHVLSQLKAIKRIAYKALQCNDRMYSAEGLLLNHQDKVELERLEHTLSSRYKKYSRFVQLFGLRQFLQMTKPFAEEHATVEEIKSRLSIYYQSYIEGSNKLIHLLERTANKIHAYGEEGKAKPNWQLIIANARLEHNFGRVRIWRAKTGSQQLPDKYHKLFLDCETEFRKSLATPKSNHHQFLEQQADLSVLNQRAQMLFEYKKIDGLKHLLTALDKHHKPQQVIAYRHLICGYIAELEQQFAPALHAYQQVIDSASGPLEQALLRIIMIDLDNGTGELAHDALYCLTQFNARYLAFYADSCRIRGTIHEAISAYIQYLNNAPGDVFVQLKLVQLYLEQKIYEGAALMLEHVLAQDPANQYALYLQQQLQAQSRA